jgi:hypothetical protein
MHFDQWWRLGESNPNLKFFRLVCVPTNTPNLLINIPDKMVVEGGLEPPKPRRQVYSLLDLAILQLYLNSL